MEDESESEDDNADVPEPGTPAVETDGADLGEKVASPTPESTDGAGLFHRSIYV